MNQSTTPADDEQLAAFVALLAMLPDSERYQVAVDLLDVAERSGGQSQQ